MINYKNFTIEIQELIDKYVINNNKSYCKEIFKNLESYHKKKLKKLIFDHYNQFNIKKPNLIDNSIIENDLLFWLNDPYSRNMDNPFISHCTIRFTKILEKIIPFVPFIVSSKDYYCATGNFTKKEIVHKILNILNVNELEEFYIYLSNEIGIFKNNNIINITLGNNTQGFW